MPEIRSCVMVQWSLPTLVPDDTKTFQQKLSATAMVWNSFTNSDNHFQVQHAMWHSKQWNPFSHNVVISRSAVAALQLVPAISSRQATTRGVCHLGRHWAASTLQKQTELGSDASLAALYPHPPPQTNNQPMSVTLL